MVLVARSSLSSQLPPAARPEKEELMPERKIRPASWTWPMEYGREEKVEKQSWWTMELTRVSFIKVGRYGE